MEYQRLFRMTKDRARRNGRQIMSDAEWEKLIARAAGRCEITGLPFSMERSSYYRRPYAPSVDRIDNQLDYTYDNCRLVIYAVNCALNEWGMDVFRTISDALRFARVDSMDRYSAGNLLIDGTQQNGSLAQKTGLRRKLGKTRQYELFSVMPRTDL